MVQSGSMVARDGFTSEEHNRLKSALTGPTQAVGKKGYCWCRLNIEAISNYLDIRRSAALAWKGQSLRASWSHRDGT